MSSLSQALRLEDLPSSHSAFQGHAAHTARWPTMLSPNGSSDTCISDGVFHIPMPCFHGAIPVYPKVLLHFSIMLHGAAQARGTRPLIPKVTNPIHFTHRLSPFHSGTGLQHGAYHRLPGVAGQCRGGPQHTLLSGNSRCHAARGLS